jgi:C1A family cysteine protease
VAVLLWASATGPACPTEAFAADAEATPATIDLAPIFAQWGLAARSQGERGTCSVFVVTGAIEYAIASRQRQATRLSVEFLNWASNQTAKPPQDGGFFSDLWNGCARFGICPEEAMPYLDRFDPTVQPSQQAMTQAKNVLGCGLQLHWIKPWNPHQGLNDEQLAEIKQTLRQQWPVCGGFLWPKQQRWENGVLQMCPRKEVRDGHSVLLVGFRDDPAMPGGGVFLIRNTAGDSREGMLTYEFVRAYMNDAAWIGCADTPPMTE